MSINTDDESSWSRWNRMNDANGLLRLLAGLRTRRLYQSTGNSGDGAVDEGEDASLTDGANVASSERVDSEEHALLLDLDVPACLVPSTTPGHSHLYIDVAGPRATTSTCWTRWSHAA